MLPSGGRLTRGGDVGSATRVGPNVQAVLGLSMTSASVGWMLLDGEGPDAASLDHDAFDVRSAADAADGDTSQHAAAARGAQAIATASGHKVGSVRVTWSEDAEADATALLKSLGDLGFDNVLEIPLNTAVQAWGIEAGCANEHTKTGLCILEQDTVTVMIVDSGTGSVDTAVADTLETTEDLVDWLRTVFRSDGWLPESLYLLGALTDLDEVAGPIRDALPIPVSDSVDAQMALARGAALATAGQLYTGFPRAADGARKDRPRRERPRRVPPAKELISSAGSDVDGASMLAAEGPRKISRRRERPWLVSHAKKLTISAAGVAVVGAALSLAAGSALNAEDVSARAAEMPADSPSTTSVSVHTVPAPFSAPPAPQAQPLAAEPPPAPPAAPETAELPAEPVAAQASEPVAVPVAQQTVSAAPSASVAATTPVAPPAAAPLAAPAPAAPAAAPPAAVAAAAPIAPPPAAPPLPPDPEIPPPDPLQAALSPLFGGLP